MQEKNGNGTCFCGAVNYTFALEGLSSSVCHCGMCRKLHGSDYTTWITVAKDDFSIDKGSDVISEYQVSEHTIGYFCSCCGTKVYSVDKRYSNIGILRGTVTGEIEESPRRQWFWDKKVPWLESLKQAKKFSGENATPVDDLT